MLDTSAISNGIARSRIGAWAATAGAACARTGIVGPASTKSIASKEAASFWRVTMCILSLLAKADPEFDADRVSRQVIRRMDA
jgi:hypothetical protein